MDVDDLLDNPKSVVRMRVLRAVRPLLAKRGLSVSMDDIAAAAGVSRRSLFRYFDSRDQLVADALGSVIDVYAGGLGDALSAERDFDQWLRELVTMLYRAHHDAGLGMWELTASEDADLPPQLAAVNRRRREARRGFTEEIARAAWRHAGGTGRCPAIVVDTVALVFSTFVVRSMLDDYEVRFERLVACAVAILGGVIREQQAVSV
jgi:AcrR family transcriptional regulator